MNQRQKYLSLAILATTFAINFYPIPKSLAQLTVASNLNQDLQITFHPPGNPQPKDTAGGASRGGCPSESSELDAAMTAIVPIMAQGLTFEARPTFLVYVPSTSAQKAFFSIEDENQEHQYQTVVSLKQTAGIISIKLPEDAPVLEVGKNYKWSFVLMCNNLLRPDSPLIEEKITRIAPNSDLVNQLTKATPIESASLYGKAGIWYETIDILAKLRINNPNDANLTLKWEQLLNSVGLEKIANEPLLN